MRLRTLTPCAEENEQITYIDNVKRFCQISADAIGAPCAEQHQQVGHVDEGEFPGLGQFALGGRVPSAVDAGRVL